MSQLSQKLTDVRRDQWKAYFSLYVLGQTDPIYNNWICLDEWHHHQSCPWLATVQTFEHKNMNFCYHCKDQCKGDYCDHCIENPCRECGQVECGGYCENNNCYYCGSSCGDGWCSKTCRRLSNESS